jgi:AraC-like DNA-binding protein
MHHAKTNRKIQTIHRAIAHLFAQNGYHAASMRAIAQKLNMKSSSLYHYSSGTVATFAFFGMVLYTIKRYRKERPVSITDLSDTFVEIFTRGFYCNAV